MDIWFKVFAAEGTKWRYTPLDYKWKFWDRIEVCGQSQIVGIEHLKVTLANIFTGAFHDHDYGQFHTQKKTRKISLS